MAGSRTFRLLTSSQPAGILVKLAEDRENWVAVVNAVMNFWAAWNMEKFRIYEQLVDFRQWPGLKNLVS
jgi:hypothetical protein